VVVMVVLVDDVATGCGCDPAPGLMSGVGLEGVGDEILYQLHFIRRVP